LGILFCFWKSSWYVVSEKQQHRLVSYSNFVRYYYDDQSSVERQL